MRNQRSFCFNGYMKFFQVYRDQIKPDLPTIIDAPGVSYSSTTNPYAVALIAHLPGELNRGNHHVFVDVLGEDGQPMQNPPLLKIGYTWEGRRDEEHADPVALDKGPNDPAAGNVVIYKGMNMVLWLQNTPLIVSDIVSGLQTETPDADPATGNSRYHNSYYIVFRKRISVTPPLPTPQPVTLEEKVNALQLDMAEVKRRIAVLEAR